MEEQIYAVSVEVRPLQGCEMHGEAAGGFAYCYTRAVDALDAAKKVSSTLDEDKYELVRMEWIMPASEVSWSEEDQLEQQKYVDDASTSGEVVYSAFSTYETEHEH